MKCIHFYNPDNRVERLSDDEARAHVKSGRARYVPRHVWKAKVRDLDRTVASASSKLAA